MPTNQSRIMGVRGTTLATTSGVCAMLDDGRR
jgi:hypothetical protein